VQDLQALVGHARSVAPEDVVGATEKEEDLLGGRGEAWRWRGRGTPRGREKTEGRGVAERKRCAARRGVQQVRRPGWAIPARKGE
jgi:hypothetical protein